MDYQVELSHSLASLNRWSNDMQSKLHHTEIMNQHLISIEILLDTLLKPSHCEMLLH